MNCPGYRDQILLSESGELSPREREGLEAHLAGCADCRACRDDLRRVTALAGGALECGEPGSAAMVRVRAAARERAGARVLVFGWPLAPTLAYAASLAVLAGAVFVLLHRRPVEPVADLHAFVAMITGEEMVTVHPNGVGSVPSKAATGEKQLRALARQLLQMEGMAVEDLAEDETATPAAAPSPTALQPRSTGASRPERCV